MSVDKLAQPIEALRQRMAVMLSGNGESPLRQQEMLTEAFEELSITLEELHLAQEHLLRQNEELVAACQTLEVERQIYQELFEFSPQAYLVTDPNGKIRKANRAAASMLGVSAQFLIGKPLIIFVALSNRRAFYTKLSRICEMQGEGVSPWKLRLQPRNREPFKAALNVTVVRDACEGAIALRLCISDISDSLRAEEKINLQSRLLEAVEQAIIATDLDGKITYWNRFAEKLYGWQSAETIGRDIIEILSVEEWRSQAADILSDLREGESWSGEFVVQHRDGTTFLAMVTTSLIHDDKGRAIGMAGISVDISDRKKAEMALRFSEARFRHLFESNIIGIFFAQRSGNITDANDAFLKLVGYDRQDLLSGNVRWDTLTPPEYAYLDERAIEEHRVSGINSLYEKAYIRKDGSLVPALIAGATLEDDPDTEITFAIDLSDRVLAQTALRESEKRFRLMAENSTDIISVYNPNGICLYVSPAIRTVLGYEPEEIIGHFSTEIVHPDDLSELRENFPTIFNYQDSYTLTPRARHKNGHYIWIEAIVQIIRNPQTGQIIEIQASSRDITQRKQTEEALRESEKRFRSIFEAAAIGMAIADTEGHFLESNRVLQEMLGYTSQELHSMTFADCTHPDDVAADWELYSALISGKRDFYQLEKRYICKNGQFIWGRLSVSVVRNDRGETQFALGMVEDITGRKQAEEALRESEERLRLALDAGQMGIWDWNVLTGDLKWSEHLEPMHGLAPGTFNSTFAAFQKLIHPDDRERVIKTLADTVEKGTDYEIEYRILLSDGSVRWYFGKGQVIYNEIGKVCRMVGVGLDITQRKQMEQNLYESQRKLSNIFESITDAFVALDRQGCYTYVNREAGRQLQKDPEKLLGKNIWEEFPEALGTIFYKQYRRAIAKQVPVAFEGFYSSANKWLEMHVYPSPEGLAVYFQDISDRKRMEEERRQTEERLTLALEAAHMGTWDWNLLSSKVTWSKNYERLFGVAADNFNGSYKAFLDRLHPEDRELVKLAVIGSFEKRIEYQQEFRVIWPDSSLHWIAAKGKIFYDETHRPVRMMGVCADITDRKLAEEEREKSLAREVAARGEAEAANRMKDEFLAIVSHELRSPLNPILGWAQLLRTRKMNEDTITRAIETIERNAKLQLNIIDDLLDVSRMIRGKIRLNVSTIDLVPTINAAIETVRSLAETKEIRVELAIAPYPLENAELAMIYQPLPFLVAGDPQRLQQVLWNLLSNAIKFTPEGGRVEVRLSVEMDNCLSEIENKNQALPSPQSPVPNPQYVQIQVIDTGKGIHPDFLPFVFERFRQADSTITRYHGGLGLGLAIVRSLVELHGGSVCVTSPGEGQGATFTVKLPLRKRGKVQENIEKTNPNFSLHPSPSTLLSGLRILVVDDRADARDLLMAILQEYEAQIVAVASTEEALELLKSEPFDLLVSDIGMPGLDGYALIRKVRSLEADRSRQIPAVALTAYARDEDRALALEAGYQKHVTKPVEPAVLVRTIANLAGREGII